MEDFERIPIRVKYIGGVVSRIVFHSYPRRNIVPGTSGYCRPVELIDLTIVFGHEPPVNGRWIRLPLLDPEERPFAIAKSPQIRMITFALVGQEERDIKRLQGRLIERQRTFDIADSQNHVVEHCSPSNHKGFDSLFTRPPMRRPLELASARCSKPSLPNQARLDRGDPSLGFTQRLDACVHGMRAQDKVVIMRDSRA